MKADTDEEPEPEYKTSSYDIQSFFSVCKMIRGV